MSFRWLFSPPLETLKPEHPGSLKAPKAPQIASERRSSLSGTQGHAPRVRVSPGRAPGAGKRLRGRTESP